MGSTIKNIVIVLGLATVAFGLYYIFIQRASDVTSTVDAQQELQRMLADNALFIQYSQELQSVTPDLSFFEDERFRSLQLYTQPVQAEPTGRSNPFSNPQ